MNKPVLLIMNKKGSLKVFLLYPVTHHKEENQAPIQLYLPASLPWQA